MHALSGTLGIVQPISTWWRANNTSPPQALHWLISQPCLQPWSLLSLCIGYGSPSSFLATLPLDVWCTFGENEIMLFAPVVEMIQKQPNMYLSALTLACILNIAPKYFFWSNGCPQWILCQKSSSASSKVSVWNNPPCFPFYPFCRLLRKRPLYDSNSLHRLLTTISAGPGLQNSGLWPPAKAQDLCTCSYILGQAHILNNQPLCQTLQQPAIHSWPYYRPIQYPSVLENMQQHGDTRAALQSSLASAH